MKKIAIVGAGGIGSNLLHIFFDYGFRRKQFNFADLDVDIWDDDVIDTKNLLHQNFDISEIGKKKVEVLSDRYAVTPKVSRMSKEDLTSYDMVFCCVDNMPFRKSLYEYGWTNPGLFWIDGRCSSRQGAVLNSKLLKETQASWLDDSTEEAGCLFEVEKENNISHTLPIIVAGVMVQTFLNHLRGLPTAKFAAWI